MKKWRTFRYPRGHLGGGTIVKQNQGGSDTVTAEVKRLDNFFPQDFVCDLVKIDVEGHEREALMGMQNIISRSENIKILFEKLGRNTGAEDAVFDLFEAMNLSIYFVGSGSLLEKVSRTELKERGGYFMAVREHVLRDEKRRSFFSIYPEQLLFPNGCNLGEASAARGQIIFHGPYWGLRRGAWRIELEGICSGNVVVTVAERFGYPVANMRLKSFSRSAEFIADRDLVRFEVIARADSKNTIINLKRVILTRIG